jgi:lipopolysaccharide export system protein LptA
MGQIGALLTGQVSAVSLTHANVVGTAILATFACCDCQVNGPEEAEAMVSRVMTALALLLALVSPSIAQGNNPKGRISATFYQAQGTSQRSNAAALPDSPFKADPETPIDIEANRLVEVVEVFGGAKQAVFTSIVKLQQGDFQLRTVSLTAFYSGQSGFSTGGEWRAEQLTRAEARERVLIMSKDGQTRATADWATFDVMANTVLMGDDVSVSRGKNVAQGPRLKIDLTTGMYRFEIESGPTSLQPPAAQIRPQ